MKTKKSETVIHTQNDILSHSTMVVLIWRFLCLRRICREYPERLMNFLTSVRRLILSDKKLTLVAVILFIFFIYRLGKATGEFLYYISH